MSTRENRRAPRTKHDSILEIFDTSGHLIEGVGRLVDFSNVGVCFSSTKVLRNGQKLHTRIRLLREGLLEADAHIVWSKKRSNVMLYGLEFDSIQKIRPTVI